MSFKQILFPIDFSDCGRMLNLEVEYLAERFNADVTLLHVFEIPFSWCGAGEAPLMNTECLAQYMDSVQQKLQNYSINVPNNRLNRVAAEGEAAWQIKTLVSEKAFDLVMMGTHGYSSMRRLLLGSTTMKVLHDVSCPVWTHSSTASKKNVDGKLFTGVKKIVCALELGDEAVPLLRFVSDLSQQLNASVRLVHSVPDDTSRPYRYFDTDLHRFLVKLADEEISDAQNKAGTYFNVDLVESPIAAATALAALHQDADLVVTGRGRTQDVFGTIRTHVYDIIREAHCSVLSYCCPARTKVEEAAELEVSADNGVPAGRRG